MGLYYFYRRIQFGCRTENILPGWSSLDTMSKVMVLLFVYECIRVKYLDNTPIMKTTMRMENWAILAI